MIKAFQHEGQCPKRLNSKMEMVYIQAHYWSFHERTSLCIQQVGSILLTVESPQGDLLAVIVEDPFVATSCPRMLAISLMMVPESRIRSQFGTAVLNLACDKILTEEGKNKSAQWAVFLT